MMKYPQYGPYVAFNNNPIFFKDPLGLESGKGSPDDSDHGGDDKADAEGWGGPENNEENPESSAKGGGDKLKDPQKYKPDADLVKQLKELNKTISKVKGKVDKLNKLSKSIDVILSVNSNSSASDVVNAYNNMRNIGISLSPGLAVATKITAVELAILMPYIEQGLSIVKQGLLESDKSILAYGETTILHPGAYTGGWAMYNFLAELKKYRNKYGSDYSKFETEVVNKGLLKVPDDVKILVKDYTTLINTLIPNASVMPYKRNTAFGVDWLSSDYEGTVNEQVSWFWGNIDNFEAIIYGGLIVNPK